jgi:hypothetical protein
MILICYDGSADAKAAIEHGAELLDGQPATVLTVWQPFIDVLAHPASRFGWRPASSTPRKSTRPRARAPRNGPRREWSWFAGAGFDAQPRTCLQGSTTSEAILAEAQGLARARS